MCLRCIDVFGMSNTKNPKIPLHPKSIDSLRLWALMSKPVFADEVPPLFCLKALARIDEELTEKQFDWFRSLAKSASPKPDSVLQYLVTCLDFTQFKERMRVLINLEIESMPA